MIIVIIDYSVNYFLNSSIHYKTLEMFEKISAIIFLGDVIKVLVFPEQLSKPAKYSVYIPKQGLMNIYHFYMKNDLIIESIMKIVAYYFSIKLPIN